MFLICSLHMPSREGNHFHQSTGSALVNTAQDPVGLLYSGTHCWLMATVMPTRPPPGVFLQSCPPPTQSHLGILLSLGQDFAFVPVRLRKVPMGLPLPSAWRGPSEQQPGPHGYCLSPLPSWGCHQPPGIISMGNSDLRKDLGRLPTATHPDKQEGQEQALGSLSSGWLQASVPGLPEHLQLVPPEPGLKAARAEKLWLQQEIPSQEATRNPAASWGGSLWKQGYHRCLLRCPRHMPSPPPLHTELWVK